MGQTDNDAYQRMAAERSRQLDEARHRQSIEDYNRSQREQAARNEQASREAYSKSLGSRGLAPPLFGPGVDKATYNRALQQHNATKASIEQFSRAFNPPVRSGGYGGGAASSSSSGGRSGSKGGFFIFLILVAVVWYFIAHSSEPVATSNPNPSDETKTLTSTPPENPPPAKPNPGVALDPPAATPALTPPVAAVPAKLYRFDAFPPPTDPASTSAPTSAIPVRPVDTPSPPETTDVPTPVPPRNATLAPWPLEGKMYHADHKGVRVGCKDGALKLLRDGLVFLCPDSNKSFGVNLAYVTGIDDDGISASRESREDKFHFNIYGMDKQQAHDLFVEWYAKTKPSPAALDR